MPGGHYVEGLKHNVLSIRQLIHKGFRVYMEDNHCVIKDKRPSNQKIETVPMTSNFLFPLRIIRDIKGNKRFFFICIFSISWFLGHKSLITQ